MADSSTRYDAQTIEHFRARLIAKKVELMARIQRNGDPIFIEDEIQGAERMDRSQAIARHDAALNGDRDRLHDVEAALGKCDDGTYGVCECGVLILLARLDAILTASRCVPCQQMHKSQLHTYPIATSRNNHNHKQVEKIGHPAVARV